MGELLGIFFNLTYPLVQAYKTRGTKVKSWTVSDESGWHCSWCFPPEGILKKMIDAPRSDFPRWGDHPEVANLSNIKKFIAEGTYFDGRPIGRHSGNAANSNISAPEFILRNPEKFKHLLKNMYTYRTDSTES